MPSCGDLVTGEVLAPAWSAQLAVFVSPACCCYPSVPGPRQNDIDRGEIYLRPGGIDQRAHRKPRSVRPANRGKGLLGEYAGPHSPQKDSGRLAQGTQREIRCCCDIVLIGASGLGIAYWAGRSPLLQLTALFVVGELSRFTCSIFALCGGEIYVGLIATRAYFRSGVWWVLCTPAYIPKSKRDYIV